MRVLISAYACEPGKGSEPGVGWIWSCAAASRHEVWVLTRANNRVRIEAALVSQPQPSIHFVYLDLPRWAYFWKRGARGVRMYYFLWQVLAGREARRLHEELKFDLVHHLTFANVWLPALVWRARAPFLLGPVAGGQHVPFRLLGLLGPRALLAEGLSYVAQGMSRLNPVVRRGWTRASLILVNNQATLEALPRSIRQKALLRPNACVRPDFARPGPRAPVVRTAVYAGRLNRFKGVELALRAVQRVPGWSLLIIGRGPDRARLERLAVRLSIEERVKFRGWLPQDELWRHVANSAAFLFPSLKEGAGFAVAEALALGIPVIAIDLGGTTALARSAEGHLELVGATNRVHTVHGLAEALARLEHVSGFPGVSGFGPERVARDLDSAYRHVAAASPCETSSATEAA